MKLVPRMNSALLAILLVSGGCATSATSPTQFPVTRVTMYDCGLAQWEREATISGNQRLAIPVARAHLDDLLASLALATDGGVKVSSVRFPSVKTLAQAQEGSSLGQRLADRQENSDPAPATIADFARMLIGVPVEVQRSSGGALTGTLVGVANTPRTAPRSKASSDQEETSDSGQRLVIMTEAGAMTWVEINNVVALRPLSSDEGKGMAALADSMGRSRGLDISEVQLETTPDSSGRLAAAHIRQSPKWRITYRVSAHDDRVSVEMWALVHNDSPEDWNNITLTMLSGLPRSFVLSLASPRYGEREVLFTDDGGALSPQLGARTPDELVFGEESYDQMGYASYGYGMGAGASGVAMGSRSGKAATVRYGTAEVATLSGEATSSLLKIGMPAALESAEPEVSKEIATYTAMLPVTIPKGTSGMVPLLRRDLPGTAFGRLSESGGTAETCVRLENTTGLILQSGTASFYIDGRFRGQDFVERTPPGDVRIWCFGEDQDLHVSVSHKEEANEKLLEFRNRQLLLHSLKTVTKTFNVGNDAGQPRNVGLAVNLPYNARFVSPAQLLSGEGRQYIHLGDVESRSSWKSEIVMEVGVVAPVTQNSTRWKELLASKSLPAEQLKVLKEAMPLLERLEKIQESIDELHRQQSDLENSIKENKDNLQAIPANAPTALLAPLVKNLTQAQAERTRLKDKLKATTSERDDATKALEKALEPLTAKAQLDQSRTVQ